MSTPTAYRQNVAAVVLNDFGKLLACHRSDIAGVWQLPQGGIKKNETPRQALLRELEEEIGTTKVEILGQLPEKIRYDWPQELYSRGYLGQEQVYFLVRIKKDAVIDLSGHHKHIEFDRFEWLTASEFLPRVSGFKKAPYHTALQRFVELYPGVIQE